MSAVFDLQVVKSHIVYGLYHVPAGAKVRVHYPEFYEENRAAVEREIDEHVRFWCERCNHEGRPAMWVEWNACCTLWSIVIDGDEEGGMDKVPTWLLSLEPRDTISGSDDGVAAMQAELDAANADKVRTQAKLDDAEATSEAEAKAERDRTRAEEEEETRKARAWEEAKLQATKFLQDLQDGWNNEGVEQASFQEPGIEWEKYVKANPQIDSKSQPRPKPEEKLPGRARGGRDSGGPFRGGHSHYGHGQSSEGGRGKPSGHRGGYGASTATVSGDQSKGGMK